MQGEIRVTVVATGFGKALAHPSHSSHVAPRVSTGTPVIPIDGGRPRPVIGSAYQGQSGSTGSAAPARRAAPTPAPERRPQADLDDLEIPTFIRRQMD